MCDCEIMDVGVCARMGVYMRVTYVCVCVSVCARTCSLYLCAQHSLTHTQLALIPQHIEALRLALQQSTHNLSVS